MYFFVEIVIKNLFIKYLEIGRMARRARVFIPRSRTEISKSSIDSKCLTRTFMSQISEYLGKGGFSMKQARVSLFTTFVVPIEPEDRPT